MPTNDNVEMTNDRLKLAPKSLLEMFIALGRKAQLELNKRAWESWDKAEEGFRKKYGILKGD